MIPSPPSDTIGRAAEATTRRGESATTRSSSVVADRRTAETNGRDDRWRTMHRPHLELRAHGRLGCGDRRGRRAELVEHRRAEPHRRLGELVDVANKRNDDDDDDDEK